MEKSPGDFNFVRQFLLFACCILFVSASTSATADEYRPSATQVKAALMYQVAKYVAWPANFSVTEDSKFVYAILGDNPFGATLEMILHGKGTVGGKKLELRHFPRLDALAPTHILFISASESEHLEEVLKRISSQPVLTIGDTPGYAERGVMINFVLTAENQVRFDVNERTLKQAHLEISNALTSLAAKIIH